MAIDLQRHIPVDVINHELLRSRHVELRILRLDQIHHLVSGNKWFKLKENIAAALQQGSKRILTFGGAYSNHLLAAASAAKAFGLDALGIVRGYHGKELPTETLKHCAAMGMQLYYVSREAYSRKEEPEFLQTWTRQYPDAFVIPEGGDNANGMKGAGDIAAYIPAATSQVLLPIGTGTTFAGIRHRLHPSIGMLGFPAMKGGTYLLPEIEQKLGTPASNWNLNADYHFGGFAKHNAVLIAFMNDFYRQHHIPLDVVYTAKMMYGIFDLLKKDHFPEGSKLLCIHTGGLQGNSAVSQYLQYS